MKINGISRWIEFSYKRCPKFYYKCGIIGHRERSCINRSHTSGKAQEEQYGAWMKANGDRIGSSVVKSATNHDHFKQIKRLGSKETRDQTVQIFNEIIEVARMVEKMTNGTSLSMQVSKVKYVMLEEEIRKIKIGRMS